MVPESIASAEPDKADVFVFPASLAQQRFWTLDQLEPGNSAYNVAVRFRLEGPLRLGILERAVNEIVRRHEILRTTFAEENGEPVQIVTPELSLRVGCIDLRYLAEPERREEAERLALIEARAPFDLKTGPLLRVSLLQLADEEHVLLITLHHAVSDGWSIGVITDEIGAIYGAFARGQASPLPELPIQFADFTLWQREHSDGDAMAAKLAYWKEKLRDAPELNLHTDRPRHGSQSFNGNIVSRLLPKPLTNALRELSAREDVTFFTLMLTAFNVLIHRYTGQEDIVLGSPIAGRSRVDLEPLIGVFINTLVLRNDLSGDPTFREVLTRVCHTVLDAMANEDAPFEKLVETLKPARDVRRNPIFQINFTFQRDFIKPIEFAGVRLTAIPSKSPGSLFDLTFFLVERSEGWRASCEYNCDLYEVKTVERMLAHFENLLAAIHANPLRKLSEFDFLTDAEERQLLVEWNATKIDYPRDQTLAEIFHEQAQRIPDAIALEFFDRTMSYRELDIASNRIANFLQGEGVGAQTIVGVYMDRSSALIVALLGILKAGAAYLPIDLAYPRERIAFIAADAKVPFVLSQRSLAGALPAGLRAVTPEDWSSVKDVSRPPSAATAESVAYVMFTSGSTGEPKGVVVPQRAVSRLVINTRYVAFKQGDVVAHASNVAFDAATFEIWGALLNGGRLVGIAQAALLSPPDLEREIVTRKITTLFLTTALFNQLARQMPRGFSSLENLVFGGDAGDPAAVREILKSGAPPRRLVNGYGPTETTTFAVCHEVKVLDEDAMSIPIGRPISNTNVYVLDRNRKLVPIGIPGELYIGGDGLALGYLNRPELTAERFVPHPFTGGARLYRSGDLARYLPDGTLECLGRLDNQVKLRGFRIELGEIEAVLGRHSAVRQCAVLARADESGQKRLVAYVVAREGKQCPTADLLGLLRESLPEYMLPAAFVFLDALPLTANGKLDTRALPAADALERGGENFEPPKTLMELALREIWEELLGVHSIGATDDFFDLGGHSLLAVRMIAEVEKRIGKKLPPRVLFENPTIRHVAAVLEQHREIEPRSPLIPIRTEGTKRPFFFLHGNYTEGGFYCMNMSRWLGADRPFYAIAPHGVHDELTYSVEKMAASRLELLRSVQPHGPYLLGGYCNGGFIAYEMARQLRAAGEEVAALIVLAADGSNTGFGWLRSATQFFGRILGHDEEGQSRIFVRWRRRISLWRSYRRQFWTDVPARERPAMLMAKGLRLFEKLKRRPPEAKPAAQTSVTDHINEIYEDALFGYVPGAFDGEMHVLWPREHSMEAVNAEPEGWRKAAPRATIHAVPGTHFGLLLGENLHAASQIIRDCLEKTDAG